MMHGEDNDSKYFEFLEEIIMSDLVIGVVSGVIASIIILGMTNYFEYSLRKKTEKCKIYELEHIGKRDVCAPPEYPRETIYIEPPHDNYVDEDIYETVDIVKLQFPFDIKEIKIYEYGKLIYPTDNLDNLPMGEAIYVNCKLFIGDDTPAFIVKCKTFRHEYREYQYATIYKYSGGFSRFGLKMIKQRFVL